MKRIYTLFISGLLLTLIVLCNLILWWAISTEKSISFNQAKDAYLNRYPAFLADSLLLTLLNIVMSATAGLCFFQIRQKLQWQIRPTIQSPCHSAFNSNPVVGVYINVAAGVT